LALWYIHIFVVRELILKKLSKEKVENIDFKKLATLTEGYST
jgi:hypothetical protein